ncbi:MAG: hypothetical protein V2A78_02500 [bacterium]
MTIWLNRVAMTLILLLTVGLLLSGCAKKTADQPAETSAPQQPITITPPSPAIPGMPGVSGVPGAPGAAAVQAPRFVPRYAMSAGRKDPFAPVVGRRPEPPPPPPIKIGQLPDLPDRTGPGGIPLVAPPPPPPPPTIQVTGIMRAGGKVMAILQDGSKSDVVGLGDKFGEYTVTSIKKKTVVLKDGGRIIKLGIPEN